MDYGGPEVWFTSVLFWPSIRQSVLGWDSMLMSCPRCTAGGYTAVMSPQSSRLSPTNKHPTRISHIQRTVVLRQCYTSHIQTFNGLFSRTTWVGRYQRINILDFAEAIDDGVAVASAEPYANHLHLAPDRSPRQHLITPYFLQAGCPSCRPTNSVKALNATLHNYQ